MEHRIGLAAVFENTVLFQRTGAFGLVGTLRAMVHLVGASIGKSVYMPVVFQKPFASAETGATSSTDEHCAINFLIN